MQLVVLDRDGVINHDSADYIRGPADWRLIDGSAEAVSRLCSAGYTVAVATNQSGLGRGYFGAAELAAIHARMHAQIAAAGGRIDHIVCCPHLPDAGCDCRKPMPGLLQQLAAHYAVSLAGVPVVGDSLRDLQAARAAGAEPVLVRSGNGTQTELTLGNEWSGLPVYDNLLAFAIAVTGGNPE